jgi:hypothetical protein
VRSALAQSSNVQGAPKRTMVLSRVVVQPGAKLALHHRLGTQISRIAFGTLTYTVRQGSAVVREGDAEKDPRMVRTPVVIYLATLLKSGAPPATPVTLP